MTSDIPEELGSAIIDAYDAGQLAVWQQARLMTVVYNLFGPISLGSARLSIRLGCSLSRKVPLRFVETWRLRQAGQYVPELSFEHHLVASQWEDGLEWLRMAAMEKWTPVNMRVRRSRSRHSPTSQ